MIPLSQAAKQVKNALFDTGVYIVFLTLSNKSKTVTLRICSNTDNLTFKGEEYTAFPFSIDEINESNKGELPSISINISNVERIVQAYIDQDPDLGSGWSVQIDISHNSNLDEPEITYNFVTNGVSCDEQTVSISCEIRNPIRSQFPRVRMLPNACQHTFTKGGCNYTGSDTQCLKTLTACRNKFRGATKIPFLGFPGIPISGIYK